MTAGTVNARTLSSAAETRRERPTRPWWVEASVRFARQRVAMTAAVALLLLVLVAVFAPLVAPYDPGEQFRREAFDARGLPVGPTSTFWLGTDGQGRDVFSRIVFGARISLGIGILASFLSVLTGVVVGGTAAMSGGWLDTLLMRFVDLVMSLPTLFVILLFVSITGPSVAMTILVIALIGWTYPSRVFRAEGLSVREREFVLAARSIGATPVRVFFSHILPQLVPLIVVYISLGVPGALFAEASLGFLGLGVPPPAPAWGGMINVGLNHYRSSPEQVLFPGLAIVVTVICFNLVGSGLRDALDPTLGER